MKTLVTMTLFASTLAAAQVDLETQRQMIRDFQKAQEAKKAAKQEIKVLDTPTKEGDLDLLRQELADARNTYTNHKSDKTRGAVGQATINYAVPLIHLKDYARAVEAIKTSIKLVGGQETLSRLLVSVYIEQSNRAVASGDYHSANRFLQDAWSEAKASRLKDLIETVAHQYRDFYWERAQVLYEQAKWTDVTNKASEALAWKIDTGPIDTLLAQVYYLRDEYPLAMDHLKSAMREMGRSDPSLSYLADLIGKESYLERDFRTTRSKRLVLRSYPNLSVDEKNFETAFDKARKQAEEAFGITTPRKVRVSIYQRSDFARFCDAGEWCQVVSVGEKLRLRRDAARGRSSDLDVMFSYAYGLWLIDVETHGTAPAWFSQGFAHQLAFPEGPPNGGRNEIKKNLLTDKVPFFEQLTAPFRYIPDLRDAAMAMAQSQSGFRFLLEKEGFGVVHQLVDRMRVGESMEVALPSCTGFDYNSFFEEWKHSFEQGFLTEATVDAPRLRALGRISPLGSYWER